MTGPNQPDRFPRQPGGGTDFVAGGDPDDVLRLWVAGDAFPRVVLDPHLGASGVQTGDGTVAPSTLSGAGTAAPTGLAGGFLSGSYPNPGGGSAVITDAHVAPGAAIAVSKVAVVNDGAWTSPTQRSANQLVQQRRKVSRWYSPPGIKRQASTLAIVAGLMYLIPFQVERPLTIDFFSVFCIVAPGAGQFRFGVYADDGQGEPTGAAIGDSGLVTASLTGNTNTQKSASIAIATPDQYWLGFLVCNNITGSPTILPYSPQSVYGAAAAGTNAIYMSGLTTTLPTIASLNGLGTETWPEVDYRISAFT